MGGDLLVVVEDEGQVAVGLGDRRGDAQLHGDARLHVAGAAAPQHAVLVEPGGHVVARSGTVSRCPASIDALGPPEARCGRRRCSRAGRRVRCGRARSAASTASASAFSLPLSEGKSTSCAVSAAASSVQVEFGVAMPSTLTPHGLRPSCRPARGRVLSCARVPLPNRPSPEAPRAALCASGRGARGAARASPATWPRSTSRAAPEPARCTACERAATAAKVRDNA